MACLFSLLSAEVTAIDIHEEYLKIARQEATRWGIVHKVRFIRYSGNLDIFSDNAFDIVFTKSILVVVPFLEQFLKLVRAKLKPGGKIVFIENAKGSPFIHALRALRHRTWDYSSARYFTREELELIGSLFEVVTTKRTVLPPIHLVLGHKT